MSETPLASLGDYSRFVAELLDQTSVKGPFRFQNNRRLNSGKLSAGGQAGR